MHTFQEDRLFVISDIHIGNPSFKNRDSLIGFLDFVASEPPDLDVVAVLESIDNG